jgi:hypothetical protein
MIETGDRKQCKRWSPSAIRDAAVVAREQGVVVRLEPDGAVVVMPAPTPAFDLADEPTPSGLKEW